MSFLVFRVKSDVCASPLTVEINANATITTLCEFVRIDDGDQVSIFFASEPSAAEITELDTVVLPAHVCPDEPDIGLGQSGTLIFFHDAGTENVYLSTDNHQQQPSGPDFISTSAPAIMPFNGEVYALTFMNKKNSVNTDLEFYINGVLTFTWSIVSRKWARKSDGLSALSFSAGDRIGLFARKITGSRPDTVSVYVYYTFTRGTEEEDGASTL